MYYDRIKTRSATGTGTGNITWTVAEAQFALPPASINELVTYTILDRNGTGWETGLGTLSESGGVYTLTRGGSQSVSASSNSGSAISLTTSSNHTFYLGQNAASVNFGLPQAAETVTTTDITAVANTHYKLTISGMTADRNLILPAGTTAGQTISWEIPTNAPTAYELILKGDTGVDVGLREADAVTAGEVTRYFIRGETGKAVYDGSEWRINKTNDGRIAGFVRVHATSLSHSGSETPSKYVLSNPSKDDANNWDSTNTRVNIRRKGSWDWVSLASTSSATGYRYLQLYKNGSNYAITPMYVLGWGVQGVGAAVDVVKGDYVEVYKRLASSQTISAGIAEFKEVL